MKAIMPGDVVLYVGGFFGEPVPFLIGVAISGPTQWGQWYVQFIDDYPEGCVTTGKDLRVLGHVGLLPKQKRIAFRSMNYEHDKLIQQLIGLRRSLNKTPIAILESLKSKRMSTWPTW